jgi:hypothetical protein
MGTHCSVLCFSWEVGGGILPPYLSIPVSALTRHTPTLSTPKGQARIAPPQ